MTEKEGEFKGLYLVKNNKKPTNVHSIVNKWLSETWSKVMEVLWEKVDPTLQDDINDFINSENNIWFGTSEEQKQLGQLIDAMEKFDKDHDKQED